MAVVPPTGVDRTRIQSQVAQPPPDPVVDPRTVVAQPPPEPPPQPPPPQGEPGTPATEPTNAVIVGEPGPQTGRPPVATTIPANTVVANRDDPAPPRDGDQDGPDVRTDDEEAIAENAANAVGNGGTTVDDTTPVNDDSIPWWPILVVLGVVLIGGGIWTLRRQEPVIDRVYEDPPISPPTPVVDPVYEDPPISSPPDVPDEPVPPQPFVPFSVRPSLDRAYGAGPPPALDWDGPRTQIRTRLEPGATTWPE